MRAFYFSLTKIAFASFVFWFFIIEDLHGRILNGYGPQLAQNKRYLESIRMMLLGKDTLSAERTRRLKSKLAEVVDFISLYEITEDAIRQLKLVSPRIFYLSDTLRDKKGRPTNIYIKLVPEKKSRLPLAGANFTWQDPNDKDLSVSEFGTQSTSIEVWVCCNALLFLSHELGHVNYIIPNLAAYTEFYNTVYSRTTEISYVGHKYGDLSGKSAEEFMRQFYRDLKAYQRFAGIKLKSPATRLVAIRKHIRNEVLDWNNVASRSKPSSSWEARKP